MSPSPRVRTRSPVPAAPRPAPPKAEHWQSLIAQALREDLGSGDVTSSLVLAADARGRAVLEARESMIVCGLEIAIAVFQRVEPALGCKPHRADGDRVDSGDVLLTIEGPLRGLLAAERTALNLLGRLCGVATLASRYVNEVAGTNCDIVDTRKTLPGWRVLDKYAAATGGAVNHRIGLFDGILLKDNHLAAAGGIETALKAALADDSHGLRVQVEVESEADARTAVEAGCDFLLIDNCSCEEVARIVKTLGDRALLEASGGIQLDNVRRYAETGVHRISIGAITHSASAADVALEITSDGVPR